MNLGGAAVQTAHSSRARRSSRAWTTCRCALQLAAMPRTFQLRPRLGRHPDWAAGKSRDKCIWDPSSLIELPEDRMPARSSSGSAVCSRIVRD
jgi:hypothetical protein